MMGMTWEWSEVYWQAITVIEAQELLLAIKVGQVPGNMKFQDLEKWHRELHKMAYPKPNDERALTSKEFAQRMREAMRGQ